MIDIYTDGAYSSKTCKGGWAFVVVKDGQEIYSFYQQETNTTNNRMELQAFIQALNYAVKYNDIYTIYSDSAYLINCLQEHWYLQWKNNGWKTYSKTAVKNQDLWEQIIYILDKHDNIFFNKVKGHDVNPWNNKADALAVQAREGK